MFFFVVLLQFDIFIMFSVYYLLKMQLQDINYIYVFKLYFVKVKFYCLQLFFQILRYNYEYVFDRLVLFYV